MKRKLPLILSLFAISGLVFGIAACHFFFPETFEGGSDGNFPIYLKTLALGIAIIGIATFNLIGYMRSNHNPNDQ